MIHEMIAKGVDMNSKEGRNMSLFDGMIRNHNLPSKDIGATGCKDR